MKKTSWIICMVLVTSLIPLSAQEPPFSGPVELKIFEDFYNLEKVVSVSVKVGNTYEIENRVVTVYLAPQEYCQYQGQEYKEYFCNIFVSIAISDTDGNISEEFQSYLNLEISKQRLFWDHAGYDRADRAGQDFGEDDPLVVEDDYIEVTLSLLHLTPSDYSCGNCETDATTYITFIDIIRFNLLIDYTQSQKDILERYGDAWEYIPKAKEFFEKGEFEEAKDEFQKAKDYFDQIGDTEMSDEMQDEINKCSAYEAATDNLKEGEDMFLDAKSTNDYQEAIDKYEEAKMYFQRAKTEFERAGDEGKSDDCEDLINQCDDEIDNLRGVGTLREKLIYIVIAIGVIAGAGIVMRQLGKGRGKSPEKAAKKGISLRVQNAETGEETTITVERTDKVGKVRQLAATRLGMIPSALLHNGKVCPPDQTVEECGLRDGTAVQVVPRGMEMERPRDERAEKLERLEQRYREGKVSKELYESLKRKLEND